MDFLYHSGVGWFNNILVTQIFLDTPVETYSAIPHFTRIDPLSREEREALQARTARRRVRAAAGGADADGDADGDDSEDEDGGVGKKELVRREDGTFTTHFAPLVAAGVPVSGTVRLTTPPGRAIPYLSVTATVECTLFALEEVATRTLYFEKAVLAGEGTLRPGSTDLPFVFLDTGKGLLPESYEGRLFSVRHSLMVRVERPWYTFDVTGLQPFALQRVHAVPALENEEEEEEGGGEEGVAGGGVSGGGGGGGGPPLPAGAASGSGKAAGAPQPPPLRPSVPPPSPLARQVAVLLPAEVVGGDWRCMQAVELPVEGWPPEKGAVTLHLERSLYELSSVIRGHIVFAGVTTPIVMVRVAVVRIEYADGEASDATIFDDSVMDARKWRARKAGGGGGGGVTGGVAVAADAEEEGAWQPSDAELEAGAAADPDLPIMGDLSLSLELDLSQLDLRPTLLINAEEDVDDTAAAAATEGGRASAAAASSNPHLRGGGVPLDVLEQGGAAEAGKRVGGADGAEKNAGGDEISVRYFLRVTLYTAFSPNARVWDAQEIVLYRNNFYVSTGRCASVLPSAPPFAPFPPKPTPTHRRPHYKTGAIRGAVEAAPRARRRGKRATTVAARRGGDRDGLGRRGRTRSCDFRHARKLTATQPRDTLRPLHTTIVQRCSGVCGNDLV
jgi:hypothetical protein